MSSPGQAHEISVLGVAVDPRYLEGTVGAGNCIAEFAIIPPVPDIQSDIPTITHMLHGRSGLEDLPSMTMNFNNIGLLGLGERSVGHEGEPTRQATVVAAEFTLLDGKPMQEDEGPGEVWEYTLTERAGAVVSRLGDVLIDAANRHSSREAAERHAKRRGFALLNLNQPQESTV